MQWKYHETDFIADIRLDIETKDDSNVYFTK